MNDPLEENRNSNQMPKARYFYTLVIIVNFTLAIIGFYVYSKAAGTSLPPWTAFVYVIDIIVLLIVSILLYRTRESVNPSQYQAIAIISILSISGIIIALGTAYQMAAYIKLPVDLLSFSESPFLNQILKIRLGTPLYTPVQDNNSYPYTPGAELITYAISRFLLRSDSIPVFRAVQYSYVILSTIVAVSICDNLARKLLSTSEYRFRPLWISIWLPFLFLVSTDPRFNLYTHSLHNDGLALLISVFAFWLITRHSLAPRPWHIIFMAILPTLGFLVKQSLLILVPIFSFYLLLTGSLSWKWLLSFILGSVLCFALALGICFLLWGDPFLFWIFDALGQKQISFLRDFKNLFDAGTYAIMGLLGGWLLVSRNSSKQNIVLWLCWLILFGTEIYTSGFAFQRNHIGPGIVIAACWFFVAFLKIWTEIPVGISRWQKPISQGIAISSVILLFGSLGLIREPINPIPADFDRYVDNIEEEFEGLDPEKVLMDTGTWIYFRENVLMKDRSAPISVHVGKNQPEISYTYLQDTIKRIESQTYDKILARQLDTGETWYDYQDRGSGVKDAILENYHIDGRIPGVQGIQTWWPPHLISEIVILIPNP